MGPCCFLLIGLWSCPAMSSKMRSSCPAGSRQNCMQPSSQLFPAGVPGSNSIGGAVGLSFVFSAIHAARRIASHKNCAILQQHSVCSLYTFLLHPELDRFRITQAHDALQVESELRIPSRTPTMLQTMTVCFQAEDCGQSLLAPSQVCVFRVELHDTVQQAHWCHCGQCLQARGPSTSNNV